jgi:hypothetical protein
MEQTLAWGSHKFCAGAYRERFAVDSIHRHCMEQTLAWGSHKSCAGAYRERFAVDSIHRHTLNMLIKNSLYCA